MRAPLTEENYSRLARAIMEHHKCGYPDALERLGQFHLNLICGAEIEQSSSLQAALLTAINTGKRAFHGGVSVVLPREISCRIPWPTTSKLNQVVVDLGGKLEKPVWGIHSPTLYFGSCDSCEPDTLAVICGGWRGGVALAEQSVILSSEHDFALSGILAGALGVARSFLTVSGLCDRPVETPLGLSLWKPETDWLKPESDGPCVKYLPSALWILGLGHLGQAFAWNLGFLPYKNSSKATVFLQDYDRVVEGNMAAGMLCDNDSPGQFKTRICSRWLEQRGFKTQLIERAFDHNTKRKDTEPGIAFCGVDSAAARALLEDACFDFIVECGLGGDVHDFDLLSMHTFPDASKLARDIWSSVSQQSNFHSKRTIANALNVTAGHTGGCGILGDTLASKAISTSFVGAYAGAIALSEIVRGLHGGNRNEALSAHLRRNVSASNISLNRTDQPRLAKSGFVKI